MSHYTSPILGFTLAAIIFWYKANAKILYGLEWSPFKWWICTGLVTNYLTLLAWWKLIEHTNIWRAGVIWGLTGLIVDLSLNVCYFGINWRGVTALGLCALAAAIMHGE